MFVYFRRIASTYVRAGLEIGIVTGEEICIFLNVCE